MAFGKNKEEKQPKQGARKVEQDDRTVKEMFTSRSFRAGGFSAIITLVAIAIVVIINVVVSKIPASVTKYDMTVNSILTLEDQTLQILDTLDEDITIYQICSEGDEDSYTQSLLEQYAAKNSHITLATKDPVLYPNFASQYTSGEVSEHSLVFVSDKRGKYVDYDDIYLTTYDSDGNVEDVSFDGEGAITSAIDYVTTDSLPVVYALTGHGETEFSDTIKAMIESDNMDLQTLDLGTTGGVPEDADCIVIAAPTNDISTEEEAILQAYMEAGGNLLLITNYTSTELTNLYTLTDYYGVDPVESIVMEGDGDHYYSYSSSSDGSSESANYMLVPNLEDVEINSALINAGYRVIMPLAMAAQETELHRSSVTVTPILTTSDKAYAKSSFNTRTTNEKEDGDLEGPFNLGVLVTEEYDDITTNMVWLTSGYLLDDQANYMSSGANADLIMAALGYMTGDVNSIAIHDSSTLFYDYLVVTASDANMWLILFVIIIPLMLLGAGVVIMSLRRKH